MGISVIAPEDFKDLPSLTSSIIRFLEKVFGKDFLIQELEKLKWKPRSKPEEYRYLMEVNIHRAARWYKLLNSLEERGYRFDLRFSIEVEEFMNLVLFYYSLKTLIERRVVDLGSSAVQGRLHSNSEQFDDFVNELFIASNYASNDFRTSIPELSGSESIDVYAEKDGIKVWCECKKLRRRDPYTELAIGILRWLHKKGMNLLIDLTFTQSPREKPGLIIKAIKSYIEKGCLKGVGSLERLTVLPLADVSDAPLNVKITLENIEYLVYAAYIGVFEGRLKIKDPKILIFRNTNKVKEVINRIERKLEEAYRQLKKIKVSNRGERKVVQIDVSDAIGAIVVPYYDKGVYKEEMLRNIENFCKDWLLKRPDIDSVVLVIRRIHLDPFGHLYAIVVEYRTITPYTPPGWSVITITIPVPNSFPSEILTNTATALKHMGLYNMALHFYEKALEINPNLKEAWNNLADLYNRLGMFEEALKCSDKALGVDASYTSALVNRGIALAQLGKLEEAIGCFNKAISINSREKKAWYNKAVILCILRKYDEARRCLSKALEIDPNYEQARNLLTSLNKN